ncbi:MAG: biopolymer transporter ExbD [Gemmatimonadaceae bacterium]|nr:biopolymer transporter ExbD [Gemmatimonadaceae bacterium]
MVSTLASTESDLSQRIRRTLDGRARRMGIRTRLAAVVLLSPLAAVTMPSYGAADSGTITEPAEVEAQPLPESAVDIPEATPTDQEEVTLEAMESRIRKVVERRIREVADSGEPAPRVLLQVLNSPSIISKLAEAELKCPCPPTKGGTARRDVANLFLVVHADGEMQLNEESVTLETLRDELRARRKLVDNNRIIIQHDERAPDRQFTGAMEIAQQTGLVMLGYPVIATEQGHDILQQALAADPAAWSEELKDGLLELQPESTIEEIAKLVRERRGWLQGMPTDPARSPDHPGGSTSDGTTVIPYGIATAASVEVVIHNVAGKPVRTLDLGRRNPGEHRVVWDRRDDEGRELGSGVYFCVFKTDAGQRWQQKVLVP